MKKTNSTGNELEDRESNEYQKRYLAHQQFGKKQELIELMEERHSHRRYDDKPVEQYLVDEIIEAAKHCPSSCDRHGVRIRVVIDRDEKAILNGLLVGGVGWIYRAPVVLLVVADPIAYAAGDEIKFMPYLDAGIVVQQISLVASAQGLHTAFSNPNVRDMNTDHFKKVFKPSGWSDVILCGAVAIGYPHPSPIEKHRNLDFDMEVS